MFNNETMIIFSPRLCFEISPHIPVWVAFVRRLFLCRSSRVSASNHKGKLSLAVARLLGQPASQERDRSVCVSFAIATLSARIARLRRPPCLHGDFPRTKVGFSQQLRFLCRCLAATRAAAVIIRVNEQQGPCLQTRQTKTPEIGSIKTRHPGTDPRRGALRN